MLRAAISEAFQTGVVASWELREVQIHVSVRCAHTHNRAGHTLGQAPAHQGRAGLDVHSCRVHLSYQLTLQACTERLDMHALISSQCMCCTC